MSMEQQGETPGTQSGRAPVMSGAVYETAAAPKSPNTGLVIIAVAGVILAAGGLAWNILGPRSAPAAPAAPVRTHMSEQTRLMREAVQMAREAQQMQREHMAQMEAAMRGEFEGSSADTEGDGPR